MWAVYRSPTRRGSGRCWPARGSGAATTTTSSGRRSASSIWCTRPTPTAIPDDLRGGAAAEGHPRTPSGLMAPSSQSREEAMSTTERPSTADLLRYFLYLGSLGFGGPVALVGYMQRDLVERRGWFTKGEYTKSL